MVALIQEASWVHGIGANVTPSLVSSDTASFKHIRPSAGHLIGSILIPIPTPVIVGGVRLRAEEVLFRFQAGVDAEITNIIVHDGETEIARYSGLHLGGRTDTGIQYVGKLIPGHHRVLWGVSVVLQVEFKSLNVGSAFFNFIGAGVDFYN